ncbi:hypothetical protein LOTGIDRAFT_154713 [Lottia gigantea]|uniref:CBM6 domain-containing protein n=1 Tax=Lottia gigantea TaxID=225164 RepID=V3ZX60_LOTGI|nr:hypothetical protein LOTGIDRAFT_154713 [Lottia gigantea]ESO87210.1 hypothetical protein LOTGIDRAFT_154713 [Lottia gigantea]
MVAIRCDGAKDMNIMEKCAIQIQMSAMKIVCFLFLSVISTTTAMNTIMVEMEDIAMDTSYKGRLFMRENASGKKTVLIHNTETIDVHFCLDEPETLIVERIKYSTDGYPDDVRVELDNSVIGHFMTHEGTNWGHLWNEFHETGVVGMPFNLEKGQHNLILSLAKADQYGVELDYIEFAFSESTSADQVLCSEHEYARKMASEGRKRRRRHLRSFLDYLKKTEQ